jgi:DNA polymerase III subunit epsilon
VKLLSPRGAGAAKFAQAPAPDGATAWRDARFVALDLELTGLDRRRNDIIAIGTVPIEQGRVVLGDAFYTLVRTTRRSEHGAVLVHKLRVLDLADAPPLDEVLERLFEVMAASVPVFHTAWVERAFLEPLFARRRVRLPAAVDTEVLGRAWLEARDGAARRYVGLEQLAVALGQPAETPHHALGDALTTAKAFVALATHLDEIQPQTVASLVAAAEHPRGPRRFGAA